MKAIGIVGGVGPTAGTDLANKVFRHTDAHRDQDHINLFLTSCPSLIPDRTEYLLGKGEDPVPGINFCLEKLALCGATVVGIACNTAHANRIFRRIAVPEGIELVNMIDKTCRVLGRKYGKSRIGLLGTLGTLRSGLYSQYFEKYPQLELAVPSEQTCMNVHSAIYDSDYGIKSTPRVSDRARLIVEDAVGELKYAGCSAVILGCTELPLIFPRPDSFLVDPTDILAVELVRATEPQLLV